MSRKHMSRNHYRDEIYRKICLTVPALHFTYYIEDNNVTIFFDISKNIINSYLRN